MDARIGGMTLCDYFAAADDHTAAAVAQAPGGPTHAALDVVSLKGIDPVVAIAQLEGIATGCSYEEASQRPRSGQLLSPPEVDGPLVFSLSDSLIEALITATPDDLVRFAEPWSKTDELQQSQVDAETAADVLQALASLARRARASRMGLYCWWSL
ncbi:hypothetical protein [Streptomyces sp. NPDC055749]